MILDAEQRADDWFRDRVFDVCVVGSGPAGITLARRLGASGLSVGLFEAGGFEITADSQDLYQGTTAGQPYYPLDGARLRYFGGSSNHWGGWTRTLDAYDFEPRAHNALSGWPIAKADLDPYHAEADQILNLPSDPPVPDPLSGAGAGLAPTFFRWSRPTTRFGEKFRAELEKSGPITAYLNANLVDIALADGSREVRQAVFRSYARQEPFEVRARMFVLCLGGIENPRALLNANRQVAAGIGNEHDLVGRFFMEHPHAPVGRVVMREPLTRMVLYSPTPETMRNKEILNFGLRIGDFEQWNRPDFDGIFDPQPPCAISFDEVLAAEMKGQRSACPANVGDAFVACEQSLNPDNRVTLTDEQDRFGLRKAALDWRLSETDLRTMRTAAFEVGRRMAEQDAGRLRIEGWLLDPAQTPNGEQVYGGNHHMGTTRMSADPKQGVVDRDCRVYGIGNLYIGGSSVFATSGHANPTYTIVQLALRLGDHLKEEFGAP